MELGIKISATLPCKTMEKLLMVTGELYICLRPANVPSIIHVSLLECLVSMLMFMRELDICI